MSNYRIAVIPGDGIGREVAPERLRVLEAIAWRFGITFAFDYFDFGSCDYYLKHGRPIGPSKSAGTMRYFSARSGGLTRDLGRAIAEVVAR